jgi:hypothetical protein
VRVQLIHGAARVAAAAHEGAENAGMPDLPTVDPTRCPLCGASNACAAETERRTGVAQEACWCMAAEVRFSDALLARIPDAARDLACICARCAAGAKTAQ